MRDTLAMILAGGVGSRLNILVGHRAKPAVPFGGIYRIIDFALSNVMNSGITHAAVLTQYKPLSLMKHIGNGAAWDFAGRTREVKILPPRTGHKDSDWYRGTADAVRQNLDFIESRPSRELLVLSGDHVYFMNYRDMIKHHRKNRAKVTVAMMTVPWEVTSQFGIGIMDDSGRIIDWEEKPEKARSNLASMGIYVFDTSYLMKSLMTTKEVDFGHHILPAAMKEGNLHGYVFRGYWKDVGTVRSYWDTHMDMLGTKGVLDTETWGVVTNMEEGGTIYDRMPLRIMPGSLVENSAISMGCTIKGRVRNSVLSPGVVVEKGASVENSVIMHDAFIGQKAMLDHVIADKQTVIGEGAELGRGDSACVNREFPEHLYDGLTLVGKWANVPENARIGTNCIIGAGTGSGNYPEDLRIPDGATLKIEEN